MDISKLSLWEKVELIRQLLSSLQTNRVFQHLNRKMSGLNSDLLAEQIAARQLRF